MGTGPSIILAAIVLLLIICIFIVSLCFRRRRRETFAKNVQLLGVRQSVARLEAALVQISLAADSIKKCGRRLACAENDPAASKGRWLLAKAGQGMSEIVDSVKSLRVDIGIKPHTYRSAIGIYQGLSESDNSLQEAAQILSSVGNYVDILTKTANTHIEDLQTAALNLQQMSSGLFALIRSVHYLGSALLLE